MKYWIFFKSLMINEIVFAIFIGAFSTHGFAQQWTSKFVAPNNEGILVYYPDEKGGIIPDFSAVGYQFGEKGIPYIEVVHTVEPVEGDNRQHLQLAINKVAALPLNADGFRGALLLKKGVYEVNGSLTIPKSGVVIRGEGNSTSGTIVVETATVQRDLFILKGSGSRVIDQSSKVAIAETFVPVGRKYIELEDAKGFNVGDNMVIFRPGTDNWIHDLKMDQINVKDGLVQWKGSDYNLYFERVITKIEGNTVHFRNPVVMEMEVNYGGGFLMKFSFPNRISNCGIENIYLRSTFSSAYDEKHGWNAIKIEACEHSWVSDVTAQYFGYSAVNISGSSKNISVLKVSNLDPKSEITGSRRYSFNCDGQLNLFKDCYSSDGRHDYLTGARVCGPNVFTRCTARNTHNDIGPHHRWAVGTLYDAINTTGDINVQDRGDWGTGHGWAGVTQVLWNCTVRGAAVQSPWVSGYNYSIGTIGNKLQGRLAGRPDGEWEGHNKKGLYPESLYDAQLSNSKGNKVNAEVIINQETRFYPNPCNSMLFVASVNEPLQYVLLSTDGKQMLKGKIEPGEMGIDTSMLKSGIYILSYTANETIKHYKVMVQQ